MYLDSRRGSNGVDGVNSTGLTLVMIIDVTAVQWEDEEYAVGHHCSQEDEDHWYKLEQGRRFWLTKITQGVE